MSPQDPHSIVRTSVRKSDILPFVDANGDTVDVLHITDEKTGYEAWLVSEEVYNQLWENYSGNDDDDQAQADKMEPESGH